MHTTSQGIVSMVLVNVSVMPHGAMLLDMSLPELPCAVPVLHEACIAAGKAIAETNPEIIIIFTPHGICTKNEPTVYLNNSVAGNAGWNGFWESYSICSPCDHESAQQLVSFLSSTDDAKSTGITCFSKVCSAPLAWGEVVPLSFCKPALETGTQLIVCTWPQMRMQAAKYTDSAVAMGRRLLEFANQHPKRVALMFSCDLSHVHGEVDGVAPIFRGDPSLGADTALAQQFDAQVVRWAEALVEGQVAAAREVLTGQGCLGVADRVKTCGWAGLCAVQGCLEAVHSAVEARVAAANAGVEATVMTPTFTTAPIDGTPRDASEKTHQSLYEQLRGLSWEGKLWGYAAPTYFGMMIATFTFRNVNP